MAEQRERTAGVGNNRRRILLFRLGAFFLLAGITCATYWLLIGRYHENTEDAYVGGNIVQVTPRLPARWWRSIPTKPASPAWANR